MLLATIHDDRPAFERIFRWTRATLAIRGDRLLAWRYRPVGGVDDINSATDADLFHAWALLRAEQRWPGQGYRALAASIAGDILRVSCRQVDGRVLLMPGPGASITAITWCSTRPTTSSRRWRRWRPPSAPGLARADLRR